MIYFVSILTLFGVVSTIVLLTALIAARGHLTKLAQRSLIMALAWFAAAGVLHLCHTKTSSFRQGIPVMVLNLDLRHPMYGAIALEELARRANAGITAAASWETTTGALIQNPWWVTSPEPVANAGPAWTARRKVHESAHDWLGVNLTQLTIGRDGLIRWLQIDPPPMFEMADEIEPGSIALVPVARFGRAWQNEVNLPYLVDGIEILAVTLDGENVDVTVVEGPDSNASAGRFAQHVMWMIEDIPLPESPGEHTIEITYTLALEPGGFTALGPLTWQKTFTYRSNADDGN